MDIRKAFYSVLVEEVVAPVMGRSDRAKVMARFGWTESERHRFEATLQGRQHETALLRMAPDVAAMLADWHQTNWFTVQGAEKRAIHSTGVRPCDPTADVIFAFAFARFHRKLVDRLGKKGLLPATLLHGGQVDASAEESEEIHIQPPAYMDDFFLPVVSDTAAGLLPRVALATQVAIETAREHGLQLNMASNKTEAVVDFRGKGRQQVLEDLALEFLSWTSVDPNCPRRGWRLAQVGQHVSALGHTGFSWDTARSGARCSSFCRKSGVPCYAQEDPESEASIQEGQGGGRPRCCQFSSALRGWYLAFDVGAMEDTYMAPFRMIANERWRPGHVPASSQEVSSVGCVWRHGWSMLLPRWWLSCSPDARRAWKAELFCDIGTAAPGARAAAC